MGPWRIRNLDRGFYRLHGFRGAKVPAATERRASLDRSVAWPIASDQDVKRGKRKPTSVGDVVAHLLKQQGADPRRAAGALSLRVYAAFARMGPPISEHAEPVLFARGVLTLQVAQSVWLTELSFLTAQIQKRMNAILGRDIVKEVRMRLGPLERPPPMYVAPKPIPEETRARIAEWSAEITDEAVRDAVVRAAERFASMPQRKFVDVSGPPGPRVARPDPEPEPEPMKYGYGDKPRDRWKGNKPRW